MRWTGQHIYDLITRYRSDVYLEGIATGTIASGGNLGLDSNNKIVKADITSLGTVTSGTWQGTVIASAYLDADTAHLTGIQTFTGRKTFETTIISDGDKSLASGDGAAIHVDTSTITDSGTSASGTATKFTHVNIERPTLAATNASVTTSDAATLYVHGPPTAGTNQTITRSWSLWVDTGNARFDGSIYSGTTEAIDSSGLVTVANQSNITGVGTISSGTWQGTAIASAYLDADTAHLSGTQTFTGAKTFDTAIATDSTKHLMHYFFKGYGTGDGTNYEIPVLLTDNQAPWEHNTSAGSDGLTAITVQTQMRMGGTVMPQACTLKKWTGWTTCSGTSGTAYIGLFKLTPTANNNSTVSLVLLDAISYTPLGNAKSVAIAETSFTASAIAAGDILVTGIKAPSGGLLYFTSTIEVEF